MTPELLILDFKRLILAATRNHSTQRDPACGRLGGRASGMISGFAASRTTKPERPRSGFLTDSGPAMQKMRDTPIRDSLTNLQPVAGRKTHSGPRPRMKN
jgi:hypothetical protein